MPPLMAMSHDLICLIMSIEREFFHIKFISKFVMESVLKTRKRLTKRADNDMLLNRYYLVDYFESQGVE